MKESLKNLVIPVSCLLVASTVYLFFLKPKGVISYDRTSGSGSLGLGGKKGLIINNQPQEVSTWNGWKLSVAPDAMNSGKLSYVVRHFSSVKESAALDGVKASSFISLNIT